MRGPSGHYMCDEGVRAAGACCSVGFSVIRVLLPICNYISDVSLSPTNTSGRQSLESHLSSAVIGSLRLRHVTHRTNYQ